jgi:predicted HTH transcriptional regulator
MASNGEGYNAEFKVRVPQKVHDLAELSQPDFGLKGTFDISLERVRNFVPEPVKIAGLSEIQNRTLTLIGENNSITADELSEMLAIGLRQTRRLIKELKDRGHIEREGSDKKGIWVVKQQMSL